MQALFLDNSSVIFLNDYPKPSVGKEQAIIRVIYAGICSTDLELVKGYAGFRGVPGHEFVGVIEQAEDINRIGQRVVGEINLGCGACAVCLGHGSAHCPQRTVLGIIEKDGALRRLSSDAYRKSLPVTRHNRRQSCCFYGAPGSCP